MKSVACLAATALLAAAPAALADTIRVPDDFGTIQAAVDAAADGDTVIVGPGSYSEVVTISGKDDFELRGKGWPLILGPAAGIVVSGGCNQVRVRGFEIDNAGVQASGSLNLTFSKLRFAHVADAFSSSDNIDIEISKCEFTDISGTAVSDQLSSGFVVEKCRFENVVGYAIHFDPTDPGTAGVVLTKNRVLNAGFGFYLAGTGAVVEKNRMEGLTGQGILATSATNSSFATIAKNRIETSNTLAIEMNYGGLTVERNAVERGGIRIVGAGVTVVKNSVVDPLSDGIYVQGSGSLEKNKVRDAGSRGIVFQGSVSDLVGNRVLGSGDEGIVVIGSGNTLTGNRVSDAGTLGFLVDGSGETLTSNGARGSGTADLGDTQPQGTNTYEKNHFAVMQFSYVP